MAADDTESRGVASGGGQVPKGAVSSRLFSIPKNLSDGAGVTNPLFLGVRAKNVDKVFLSVKSARLRRY